MTGYIIFLLDLLINMQKFIIQQFLILTRKTLKIIFLQANNLNENYKQKSRKKNLPTMTSLKETFYILNSSVKLHSCLFVVLHNTHKQKQFLQ